jgi:hypothetical protein
MIESVPKLVSLLVAAESLSVSPHTIRMWVRQGRLRPSGLCRKLLFHPAELQRFVNENGRPRGSEEEGDQ